jgi:opacity protein-like surface antigen
MLSCHALALALLFACCLSAAARAQASSTASRPGDLQFGGGFTYGSSDYNFNKVTLTGVALYADFNNREHWGFEGGFHQLTPSSDSTVYQRTFEVGPRFFLTRGRLTPYAKLLYGRGVYNFSGNVANIAYNLYTVGGGGDLALTPTFNLRADYELQSWLGFPLATLHPNLYTIGLAYHFRAYPKPPR